MSELSLEQIKEGMLFVISIKAHEPNVVLSNKLSIKD